MKQYSRIGCDDGLIKLMVLVETSILLIGVFLVIYSVYLFCYFRFDINSSIMFFISVVLELCLLKCRKVIKAMITQGDL